MRARARWRDFSDTSWNGLVSRIVAAYGVSTTPQERVKAARDLEDGKKTTIAGVTITPL
jgi:hypothetical protein